MLPVSLNFPFLIARSVFPSVYLLAMEIEQQLDKTNSLKLNISTDVKKCKKEELLILHEDMGSPPVFSGFCVAHIFSFCGVLCFCALFVLVLYLVCPILTVSLECHFVVSLSVYTSVYN